MGELRAIRGEFESPKAMLHDIAGDETIKAFVILTIHEDGVSTFAQIGCTRKDLAFASIVLARNALSGDD